MREIIANKNKRVNIVTCDKQADFGTQQLTVYWFYCFTTIMKKWYCLDFLHFYKYDNLL